VPRESEPIDQRFDRLVVMSRGCWTWTGPVDAYGYGQVSIGHRGNKKAHRLAFEMAYGPLDASVVVRHTCDNRACVKPEHLDCGSQRDNVNDALHRGRLRRDESGRWIGERIMAAAA
jgi:hypothetical protein